MLSRQQRRLNFFYKNIVKPLRLFDGRSAVKRVLLNYGSFILSTKTKKMKFETKTVPISNGTMNVVMCSEGEITSDKIIFYLHGGGFSTCGPLSHRQFAARLAQQCGGRAALIDYPLAPEVQFPVSINQIFEVYCHFLESGTHPKNIIIAGDSAGGNLASALLYLTEQKLTPTPSGLILFSPALDLTNSLPSHVSNKKTELILADGLQYIINNNYIGTGDLLDPLASPLFAQYKSSPPILIFAANDEVLRDDSLKFAEKMAAIGGDVELITADGVPHVWPIQFGRTPEADLAIAQCKEFMARF